MIPFCEHVSFLKWGGGRKYPVLFKFLCDESYESKQREPRTYVVAGYFSDDITWGIINQEWSRINGKYGVPRFHASHLNAKTYEYEGWDDERKLEYSKEILKVITDQGKRLHAFVCGIHSDHYYRIINDDGRKKLGHPYIVCFKTCITMAAMAMDKGRFPPEDQIAVFFDRNPFKKEARDLFDRLQENEDYPYRFRLDSCTPKDMETMVPLQAADLIAYEAYRWFDDRRDRECKTRAVMDIIQLHNGFFEGYFGAKTF